MKFRRRGARRRHPSSREHLDLAALWGDPEELIEGEAHEVGERPPGGEEPVPGGDEQVTGGEEQVPGARATVPGAGALEVAPRPRGPGGGGRQAVGVGLLACALAAGLIADRTLGSDTTTAAAAGPPAMPAMAVTGALSSTWFCPALGASVTSPAKGRLILANPSATALTATVTVVPSSGSPIVDHRVLAPYTRTTLRLEEVAPGAYAAATVAFDGASGAVEQEVQGPIGESITACASSSSDHWYFASGATDANAREYLSLYNPYPAPAIADLRFETDQGLAIPDAFQGVVVPGGGFNVIDVGARVRSRSQVAAVVDVRGGRLAVDKLQVLANPVRSGPRGLVLTLGAPALGMSWYYANGDVGPGVTERFDVYNPGSVEADVSAAPILEQGSADPFDLSIPPEGVVSLPVDQQARIPPGVGEAWVLTSANGVPVVVERVIISAPPAAVTGVGNAIGAPGTATRWVFAGGSAADGADEWLIVFDPGAAPARVSVVASGAGTALQLPTVVVAPGSRTAVDVGRIDPVGVVVLDVTSDVPVVAERAQYVTSGPGMSDGTGIAGP